jgi:16S rRNA processing protein RimM
LKHRDNTGPTTSPSSEGEPAAGSPSVSSGRRPKRPAANPKHRGRPPVRTLIETAGPEPATPLADVRLTVGRIGGTHGVRGELKMRNLTDDPEHLKRVERVYLGNADTPIALKGVRFTKDGALITLEGVTTPEAGARLSGLPVKIAGTDARPLEEGEYFLFQLIGLKVLTEDGTPAGTVTDLMETGAHDVLVIGERPDAADDLLVPNHPEFVLEISPEKGTIIIRPPVYGN